MTMIKLGPGITDIEGAAGGNIYRRDDCLAHLQKKPRNPNSPYHHLTAQTRAFRKALTAWNTYYLTPEQISLWWEYCFSNPIKSKKGDIRYLHPFLAFLSVNIKRILNDEPIIFTPPS